MFEVTEGIETPPISVLLYGPPGSGKTSLAAKIPNHLIFDLEKGSHHVDAKRVKLLGSQFKDAVRWFADQPYTTMVVDSVTALESAMVREVCKLNNWKNIEQPGYGKGHEVVRQEWQTLIMYARHLMDAKGKNIVWIAHSQIKPVKDPTNPNEYDRMEPAVSKKALTDLTAAVDAVLFLREKVTTYEKDGRKLATGSGKRELIMRDIPAALAKVRNEDHPLIVTLKNAIHQATSQSMSQTNEG